MLPTELIPAVRDLVDDLVAGNYEQLERDGRAGRTTADELRAAIKAYGRKLVPLPSTAFEKVEANRLDDGSGWWMDIDLWTAEEGRSDLTLSATARVERGKVTLVLDDLHVL